MKLTIELEGGGEIYLRVLSAICGDVPNQTLLDVCCGEVTHTKQLNFKSKTHVDIIDWKANYGGHEYINQDVFEFFKEDRRLFDVCLGSDCIEHFRLPDALRLLKGMADRSVKQIIFTPLGPYMMEPEETNNPHSHKSAWTPEQLPGWASITFPNFHRLLGIGAFFAWDTVNLKEDFERVKSELSNIL